MDSPIRVLHVVVNMNRGGAETLIMNLYRNIDHSLIQFDFLTCKSGVFDEEIEAMGGKVHRIPYITDGGPFKFNKSLEMFFMNHPEYKIVHSHLDKMSGFVLCAAKKYGVAVRIAHSHNTSSEGNIVVKSFKWYSGKLIVNNASHYFACSKVAAEWLFGKNSNNAILLKNGIDTKMFKYTPGVKEKMKEQYNLSKESFIVGHVGRFCYQKNHEFLIDIFSKIHEINPDSYLILVGDGPLKNKIKQKIERFGLTNNVLFLGIQSNINEILQVFDVMIFPSLHEGLPVTLIEAQSVGVTCLISNNITTEVDIGSGLIQYQDIKTSPIVWAQKALFIDIVQKDAISYIKQQGYDIKHSSRWLQKFYINVANVNLSLVRGETG